MNSILFSGSWYISSSGEEVLLQTSVESSVFSCSGYDDTAELFIVIFSHQSSLYVCKLNYFTFQGGDLNKILHLDYSEIASLCCINTF